MPDGGPQAAEEIVKVKRETRYRVRKVEGVGEMREQQDVVFTQKQIIWRDEEKKVIAHEVIGGKLHAGNGEGDDVCVD
jgi:hypothetical protein